MIKEMTKLLYDEEDGVFMKLRDGDYERNEEDIEKILEFAKELNLKLRYKAAKTDEVLFIYEVAHTLIMFSDVADWTEEVANEIYKIVFTKLDLEWRE